MPITAGDAVIKITGDTKELNSAMKNAGKTVSNSAKKMQTSLKAVGIAFTAMGAAGLAMIQTTKKINASLSVTALNLGVTTKEMRDLTLATTNVTFPIDEVVASFDLLARAGVKDIKVLQDTATAFDTLGDATGYSASQVTGFMVPAMKTFGLTAEEMAAKTDIMTYMSRQSTMSMEDFNTMVGYTTPELVKQGLTIEDLTAGLIYMERQGYAPGRVMTREFMKATTLAAKEEISLTEALGMTSGELASYKEELAGATGMTQEYADAANKQYTLLDKIKQKWSEITLAASGFLEPLEPILAGMTAMGPLLIIFSAQIGKVVMAMGRYVKSIFTKLIPANVRAGLSFKKLAGAAGGLAIGIGLITYGLSKHFEIQEKNKNMVELATQVTEEYNKALAGEANNYREVVEQQINMMETFDDLTEKQKKYIADVKEWIKAHDKAIVAAEKAAEATEAQTAALEEYYAAVESVKEAEVEAYELRMDVAEEYNKAIEGQANNFEEALDALIDYEGGWDSLDDAQKNVITTMREYVEALEEVHARQMDVYDSWVAWAKEVAPAVKAFDELGLTVEDVVRYLSIEWDMTISQVITKLQAMDIAVGDVRWMLSELGITAEAVAHHVGKLNYTIEELIELSRGAAPIPSDFITWEAMWKAAEAEAAGISLGEFEEMALRWQQLRPAYGQVAAEDIAAMSEEIFGPNWRWWRWALGLGGWAQGLPEGAPPPSPPGAQAGMMITEPTLLTSMRTMRPYAMAGEAGPERLLGVAETRGGGGYGSANIIIQLDGETIARAVGQPLVDEIRIRTGVHI